MNDQDFNEFMGRVDELCVERLGVSVHDLPDVCWRDYADDGLNPEEALEAAREDGILV